MTTTRNAWGELVEVEGEDDDWFVPEDQRLNEDRPYEDPDSNAMDDETGNDLDGWNPGDPV